MSIHDAQALRNRLWHSQIQAARILAARISREQPYTPKR